MVDKQETAIVEPTVHPAVELLLARMKSNPDEFASSGHRWSKIVERYQPHFNDAEREALGEGMRTISMNAFHTAVMNELLKEPEETVTVPHVTSRSNAALGLGSQYTGITNQIYADQLSALQQATAMRQVYGMQQAYGMQNAATTPTTGNPKKSWLGGLF